MGLLRVQYARILVQNTDIINLNYQQINKISFDAVWYLLKLECLAW